MTDITYIHTNKNGWCYLSSIQDLHSKKIIAWKFGQRMTTDLVLETLDSAIAAFPKREGLILHPDLGSQYTSNVYENRIKEVGIRHYFSKKDLPHDNAGTQSFHITLKKEEVYQQENQSYTDYN